MIRTMLAAALFSGALSGAADESLLQRLEKDRAAVIAVTEAIGARLAVTESYVRRGIISTRTPYGFKVSAVSDDSPAAKAGISPRDILMKWDGKPIESVAALRSWIDSAESGSTVTVLIARRKKAAGLLSRRPWEDVEAKIVLPKTQ
jgi:C-terminal processing protease CtpA/Prc